jgi:hypothetical protein
MTIFRICNVALLLFYIKFCPQQVFLYNLLIIFSPLCPRISVMFLYNLTFGCLDWRRNFGRFWKQREPPFLGCRFVSHLNPATSHCSTATSVFAVFCYTSPVVSRKICSENLFTGPKFATKSSMKCRKFLLAKSTGQQW